MVLRSRTTADVDCHWHARPIAPYNRLKYQHNIVASMSPRHDKSATARRRRRDARESRKQRRRDGRPQRGRGRLLGRLRDYFLAGILVTAPITITIWLTWEFITFVDGRVTPLIPYRWNPEAYLPFGIPGLGVVVVIFALVIIGMFAAGYVGRMIMLAGESLLARVPVVRSVYGAVKQIFETVLAQQSTAFRQVALIEYPCRGVWSLGFVTGKTVGEVQRLTEDTVINVFVPATPNPTTGFLLFVPRYDVHIVDMAVEDGAKLLISGGLVTPPNDRRTSDQSALPEAPAPAAQVEQPVVAKPIPSKLGLMARLRNYFLAGLLVTAPLAITIWLTYQIITFVDNQVRPLIPPRWLPETYLPFGIPGLGIVIVLVGLTLIGMLAAGFVGRTVMRTAERAVFGVPVIRSIYGALKQIFETVLAQKSDAFREAVLFPYPRPGLWAIGFVTGQTEGHVQEITEDEVVNVFLPTTPNPTSGFLLFVPRKDVIPLSMTMEEALKMVVSGGIVTPADPETGESEVETVPEERPDRASVGKPAWQQVEDVSEETEHVGSRAVSQTNR